MPPVVQRIQQLELDPGTIERRQDIDLRLGNEVLEFFFRRVRNQAGMRILMNQPGELYRRTFTGNDERHFQKGKNFFQQPYDYLLIFRNRQITVIETETAGSFFTPHLFERKKNSQRIDIFSPEFLPV